MTIGPNTAIPLSDEQLILLARVQSEIDVFLSENFVSGKTLDVRTALFLDAINSHPKVVDALVESYRQAGWSVALYNNKRQGQWLSFSEPA